jgi:5'-nucleotidase
MVICLSHLGYHYNDSRIDDRKLASRVDGIDLIIGGHTHTFMNEPEVIASPGGGKTLVTQAGHSGIVLGRLEMFFNDSGKITDSISSSLAVK